MFPHCNTTEERRESKRIKIKRKKEIFGISMLGRVREDN